MFGWFKRKKTGSPVAAVTSAPEQAAAAGPAEPVTPLDIPLPPEPTPMPVVAVPVVAADVPAQMAPAVAAPPVLPVKPADILKPGAVAALEKSRAAQPEVGQYATVVAGVRIEDAKVVRVQAGGRRVLARVGGRREQAYSRRRDGSYWLEGGPAKASSRLLLGVSV